MFDLWNQIIIHFLYDLFTTYSIAVEKYTYQWILFNLYTTNSTSLNSSLHQKYYVIACNRKHYHRSYLKSAGELQRKALKFSDLSKYHSNILLYLWIILVAFNISISSFKCYVLVIFMCHCPFVGIYVSR